MKYLINAGAEFKVGDNEGWTPLHYACAGGHLDIVEHLVSLGADVNKVKNDGATPLHIAATHGQLDTVKYLISEGAVIDKQTGLVTHHCTGLQILGMLMLWIFYYKTLHR